ncbi:hypothetical protein FBZ89_1121 [Nitrospirillum amazonense]|uniref:Uncharacterized protein n=1 Tax=Nitrospirillum amazonense TaxID=28077 RepID=A0A560F5N6_9PROT|nr:hypothetical protein [Nitrospirillum amazonense]TWB16844.1 hypothetical protein FBZ89_1121 [Nitrospirillum amazonense]
MNWFGIVLGVMIVLIGVKPAFQKAQRQIKRTRRNIKDLQRRRFVLSQQVRTLARESLSQRLTSAADGVESAELTSHVKGLTDQVNSLESVDRRILVTDERRGLQETGWIVLIRRTEGLPMEPTRVVKLWEEGRYYFFFASDLTRARRKAQLRFPAAQGYEILDVVPHEGDLSENPTFGAKKQSA